MLGALSWRLCSGSRLSHGWSSPSPALDALGEGLGVKSQARMRVVACRKARARVPVRIPTSYLRNAGRSVPASRILKSRARSPWSRPNPNQGSLLCAGLLSSSWEGATTGCCRAASGGPASRAQGAAIWSLAAGGARVLGTGPTFGTRGQGPRPARWSSAWWQRRLVASELVEIMGGCVCVCEEGMAPGRIRGLPSSGSPDSGHPLG